MSDFGNAVRIATSEMRNAELDLGVLSSALRLTGNSTLAARLDKIGDYLGKAGEQLDTAYCDHVDEIFKNSVDATNNMIEGVLTGIKIGERHAAS